MPINSAVGCLDILNVEGGEVQLTFNNADAGELIRARRMITEMIRRGFVLLVEVERNGEKRYERALAFDEASGSYVIADYSPDIKDESRPPASVPASAQLPSLPAARPSVSTTKPQRGRPRRNLPMESTKATAVGPSAGG